VLTYPEYIILVYEVLMMCDVCRYWFVETSRRPTVWLNIVVQT